MQKSLPILGSNCLIQRFAGNSPSSLGFSHHSVSNVHRRWNSPTVKDGRPFRMAVLGSGPAGFYTAYKVMSSIENAIVDMYEYLPVPFGLVRFGVAPDHPEVKVRRGALQVSTYCIPWRSFFILCVATRVVLCI